LSLPITSSKPTVVSGISIGSCYAMYNNKFSSL